MSPRHYQGEVDWSRRVEFDTAMEFSVGEWNPTFEESSVKVVKRLIYKQRAGSKN